MRIALLLLLLLSWPSLATWYQGQASQNIRLKNYEKVRTATIKQAIANAAMQGQSYIQAEDIMLDGLLQSSKTVLRSKGQIRRVEVIEEYVNDSVLTVIVRADIEPMRNCEKDHYAKNLINTQFTLKDPVQASVGALFNLGRQTSKRFQHQLNAQPKVRVKANLAQAIFTDNQQESSNNIDHNLSQLGNHLALKYASQYILFGYIRDISLFEQVKDEILYVQVQLRRNFTIQVYLYDAIRNHLLINKSYHGEAKWDYPIHHQVDTNNSEFWRNDYGRAVLHTINNAVTDINDQLTCQQSLAQIIDHYDNQVVINIGENQGVKVGDEFDLIRLLRRQGADGTTRVLLSEDESTTLSVSQVNKNSAILDNEAQNFQPERHILNFVSPKIMF